MKLLLIDTPGPNNSRSKEHGELTDHFDKLASLSETSRKNLELKLAKAKEDNDKYEEALMHTGIPAIEEAINEYIKKYAY